MDSVWFVRPGPSEELRFSLRSAYYHAGVENVWIVGDPPEWYTGPRIPGNRYRTKQRNVYDNVRILAEHPDLPDEVAVWNDDFFAMEPVTIEMAWRCTLDEHLTRQGVSGWWKQSLEYTMTHLTEQGIAEPLSYELHRPFPIVRADMARILADAAKVNPDNPPQWRTLYGVLTDAGGTQDHDGKVYGPQRPIPSGPWLSTSDGNVGRVMDRLEAAFPEASPWEVDQDARAAHPRKARASA